MPRKRIEEIENAKQRRIAGYLRDNTLRLRREKKWFQEDLVEHSGLALGTIQEVEQGKVTNPTLETIVALSDGFGIKDPLDLLRKPNG